MFPQSSLAFFALTSLTCGVYGAEIRIAWSATSYAPIFVEPGDILTFSFTSYRHDVHLMTTEEDFNACAFGVTSAAFLADVSTYSYAIPSGAANGEKFYFACSPHCVSSSQKIQVNILGSQPVPAPAAAPVAAPVADPTALVAAPTVPVAAPTTPVAAPTASVAAPTAPVVAPTVPAVVAPTGKRPKPVPTPLMAPSAAPVAAPVAAPTGKRPKPVQGVAAAPSAAPVAAPTGKRPKPVQGAVAAPSAAPVAVPIAPPTTGLRGSNRVDGGAAAVGKLGPKPLQVS
jgi:hypothetical protein